MSPTDRHSASTAQQTTPTPARPAAPDRAGSPLRQFLPDVAAFATALVTAVLAALLLAGMPGCGGGVGGEGTGTFSSVSFAAGPITGFGSIVVNDVRFNDSAASVVDDDGRALDRSVLALGSQVQVSGGKLLTAADGTVSGTATRVQVSRAVVGPAAAVNASLGRLQVLGQPVRLTLNTAVDDRLVGGLASLAAGQVVEVHGNWDANTASFVATRIGLGNSQSGWRVSGPVNSLNTSALTFRIGDQTYSYAGTAPGLTLANGALVQMSLKTSLDSQGRWQASSSPNPGKPGVPEGGEATSVRGVVFSMASASLFVLEGITVDASSARVSGVLRVGASVKVKGVQRSGVLQASEVEVNDESLERDFDLEGSITSVDMANRRLVLRGTTVSFASPGLKVDKGQLSDLKVGRLVRIKGALSADKTVLEAKEIKFED